jgi:hypothetical protein
MASTNEEIIIQAVRKFGIDILVKLSEQIVSAGKVASASLLNSLTYDLQIAMPEIIFTIYGESYFKFIEEGSKPHFPKLDLIKM